MKPYPIPGCTGNCHQGDEPCKTEALCMVRLHRVTVDDVTHAEYEEARDESDISIYSKGAFWAAVVIVALIAGAVLIGSPIAEHWPRLVALLSP